jgi:hypothetical protein
MAIRFDALLDADPTVTRDQHRRHPWIEGVDLASIVAANLDHILESRRRDQCPFCQFPL